MTCPEPKFCQTVPSMNELLHLCKIDLYRYTRSSQKLPVPWVFLRIVCQKRINFCCQAEILVGNSLDQLLVCSSRESFLFFPQSRQSNQTCLGLQYDEKVTR